MSLLNFTLPYPSATPSPFLLTGAAGHSTINNLRLNAVLPPPPPLPAYDDEEPFRNEPYIPPPHYQQQRLHHHQQQQQQRQRHQHSQQITHEQHVHPLPSLTSSQDTRYANYNQDFRRTQPRQPQQQLPLEQQTRHLPPLPPPPPPPRHHQDPLQQSRVHSHHTQKTSQQSQLLEQPSESYPERPNEYTRVNSQAYSGPDTKTSVHAVLDYDDDDSISDDSGGDYYDEGDPNLPSNVHVTPIQGPILVKNGSVPVVPLYSYPQLNNGTFVQIPILWTALSVALGVELKGDVVRGTPCIKRYHQLYCPAAGNTYPIDRIEQFIDENKALMKRMYGNFEMTSEYGPPTRESTDYGTPTREATNFRPKRDAAGDDIPDGGPTLKDKPGPNPETESDAGDSFFGNMRNSRQSPRDSRHSDSGRIDACESKMEIMTPYWASNSAGKIRAIVNTQHFEQAIHQEICSKTRTNRCNNDCGCEQKYKWHRLLAYDPDNDCKGIFMDWFLFPSCCVCRCEPSKFAAPSNQN